LRSARKNLDVARSLYDVLGVSPDADDDAVKQAYRRRARELHPDVSGDPDAHARFAELSEAHDVLSRPESRRLYDRWGWRGRGRGFEPRRGRTYAASGLGFIQDLEALIAMAAGQRAETQPTEVVGSLEVDAYEAHVGATRTLEVPSERPCEACGGKGKRRAVSHPDFGRLVTIEDCSECGGTGAAPAIRPLDVPVPPGARDLDRVPIGPEQVAIVRLVPVQERVVVQTVAVAGLLLALGFLLFLLAL
jgi:molecular chaperone DnaJ